jgi:hypothetical protein
MRHHLLAIVALIALQAEAFELIDLHQRVATFTNLQREVFAEVTLAHGDSDGVVWRKEASGGRVCYTNLDISLLEQWGIPTNRIEIARQRAGAAAASRARVRAMVAAKAAAEAQQKAREDAAWQASQPARERAAQQEKDAEEIATLQAQIDAAKTRMRRAKAIASDYNSANPDAPSIYIKKTEQIKIDEAADRLKAMRKRFAEKYGAQ